MVDHYRGKDFYLHWKSSVHLHERYGNGEEGSLVKYVWPPFGVNKVMTEDVWALGRAMEGMCPLYVVGSLPSNPRESSLS